MHRFYAPKIAFAAERILLGGDETHHLRDVLRHDEGDEVLVFDGEGCEYLVRIETIGKKESLLTLIEKVGPSAPESPLDLTLAAAILKGEKFDLVIQKAVELGVKRLVPLQTIRCEVKINDGEKKRARWQKIALDAAKQCGRATLMTVENPVEFARFIDQTEQGGRRLLFSERDGEPAGMIEISLKITAIVGPTGGWDDGELEAARQSGARIITFGGRILRADTAAISIATILQHRFGDMN